MQVRFFWGALALLSPAAIASAQEVPQGGAVVASVAPPAANAVLRIGTEVPMKLAEELTTQGKKLKINQRFHLETAEDVLAQGVVVIPAGSRAVGEITEVRNKGMWGKSGHFTARVLYVSVNGRPIRLTGSFDDKGTAGGIGAVAVSAVVFLPAGFFMTGTSARLPIGTPVKAFTDEDVPVVIASPAPVPLTVSAPAPVTPAVAPQQNAPGAAKAASGSVPKQP